MSIHRVRVKSMYRYVPTMLDTMDCRNSATVNEIVRVVNLPNAPKANTMGQCYINNLAGDFLGMVCTQSLQAITPRNSRRTKIIASDCDEV